MNRTFTISCISVLIVCTGFGLFYLFKILPAQQNIDFSRQNIQMYKSITAVNQKKLLQQKKEQADQVKQAKEKEKLGQKVNSALLPSSPDIEQFFVSAQREAEAEGVTFISVLKDNNPVSNSNGGSRQRAAASLLGSGTYTITMNAQSQLSMLAFIAYLESQKRLLVINQLTFQQNNQVSAGGQTVTQAGSSASSAQTGNSSQPSNQQSAKNNKTSGNTSSKNGGSSPSNARTPSNQGAAAATQVTQQPKFTTTLTLTLYSAKH